MNDRELLGIKNVKICHMNHMITWFNSMQIMHGQLTNGEVGDTLNISHVV